MVNRKYNRIFVLMTGKNAGQSLNGSCDMEVINGKGRLYAYVGKLNKLTYKPRKLYLISVGLMGTLAVSAGSIKPKGSNASIEVEFDPNDLFGSGMTFEEINAVAIWSESDGPNNAIIEGFVTKKLNWHSNLDIFGETTSVKLSHKENEVVQEIKPIDKKEETSTMEKTEKLCRSIFVEPEPEEKPIVDINELEEVEDSKDINELEKVIELETKKTPIKADTEVTKEVKEEVKEDISEIAKKLAENINATSKYKGVTAAEAVASMSPHDTFRAISEKFRKELEMLDEMGVIDKKKFFGDETEQPDSSVNSVNDTVKAETVSETKSQPSTENAQPKKKEDIVEEIKNYEDNDETEQCRIPIEEMTLADRLFVTNDKLLTDDGRDWIKIDYREAYFFDNSIRDIRNPYVKNAVRKGRHMIIGKDGQDIYIGIPGKENERDFAQQHGFNDFLIVKNMNEAGYWIKAI